MNSGRADNKLSFLNTHTLTYALLLPVDDRPQMTCLNLAHLLLSVF